MRSKLPAAEQFEAWVMEDVLPAIRQHGGYLTPKLTADALIDPDVIINLATQLKQNREKLASIRKAVSSLQTTLALAEAEKAKVSEELAVATPKAILVDEVFARPKHDGSERLFKLQDVVRKLARVNTLAIKRDLERLGYLYKRAGVYRVYSLYRDKLFTEKYDCRNGKTDIYATKEGAALISKLHKDKRLTMKG